MYWFNHGGIGIDAVCRTYAMKMRFTTSRDTGFQLPLQLQQPYMAYKVPLNVWFNNTFFCGLSTIVLLAGRFGSGTEVNGSKRWIRIAGFTLQASEVAKVMMAIFTADYVVRRAEEVRIILKVWCV